MAGTGGSPGRPHWAWVGAHGGAGVTTLAEVVPGGADFGRDFPAQVGMPGLPAVVVCRSNAQGLAAARKAAAVAASFATELLGLVVVADMPERRRPKPLAEALYLTRGAYHVFAVRTSGTPWRGRSRSRRVTRPLGTGLRVTEVSPRASR